MGGSSSKDSGTENNGLLNGNIINNGKIVQDIDTDLNKIERIFHILLVMISVMILMSMVKTFVKYIKKENERERRLEQIVLNNM